MLLAAIRTQADVMSLFHGNYLNLGLLTGFYIRSCGYKISHCAKSLKRGFSMISSHEFRLDVALVFLGRVLYMRSSGKPDQA